MLISDIAWTSNDLFVVIAFSANFFCVLSRTGSPIQIVIPGRTGPEALHFYVDPGNSYRSANEECLFQYLTVTEVLVPLAHP